MFITNPANIISRPRNARGILDITTFSFYILKSLFWKY